MALNVPLSDVSRCKNTHLRLIDHGIRGNGYMMILEKNNREIAAVIAGWLEANVSANIAATGG